MLGLRRLFRKTSLTKSRKFCSVLYIPGNKASKEFAVVNPFIDFERKFTEQNNLKENLEKRNLSLNVEELFNKWKLFKEIKTQKEQLESNYSGLSNKIKELLVEPQLNKTEIDKLKSHLKIVKTDIKNLKQQFYEFDENVNLEILNLPNKLHDKTSIEPQIVYLQESEIKDKSQSHMSIADLKDLIEYKSSMACFLKNEAALFELSLQNYTQRQLLDNDFTQLSNPDFVKSVVVEGSGLDFKNEEDSFILSHNLEEEKTLSRLHLVGGATIQSFIAYFTKHSVNSSIFPIKYFSLGRIYEPSPKSKDSDDLFSVNQQTGVSIFVATERQEDEVLENLVNLIKSLYLGLNQPNLRIVFEQASKLTKAESLRISIQLFSNFQQQFVEVGYVSYFDSYLSERLLFCSTKDKQRIFPKIYAGNLVNVHKILACSLESDSVNCNLLLTKCKQA